jgi:hypothetical protein
MSNKFVSVLTTNPDIEGVRKYDAKSSIRATLPPKKYKKENQ